MPPRPCPHLLPAGLRYEVLVCDPITGGQHRVPIPPEFKMGYVNGAVLCAARDKGHMHGTCFTVVCITYFSGFLSCKFAYCIDVRLGCLGESLLSVVGLGL